MEKAKSISLGSLGVISFDEPMPLCEMCGHPSEDYGKMCPECREYVKIFDGYHVAAK